MTSGDAGTQGGGFDRLHSVNLVRAFKADAKCSQDFVIQQVRLKVAPTNPDRSRGSGLIGA
ncbi:hypothetical protein [Nocardioides sp. B-3]|uniref:hypothetical protein n=1 Tax=Nocardioides sp. B-3 TaxID=2895565 RepID=UPI0021521D01|nr:hypothetical protein [Nocardioides sp. B-3]UUZ59462.1 hypothetical protein LP418_27390 [Nocardioides sp. B-3]